MPHVLLGALLVLVCIAGFVWWSLSVGGRSAVLVLARPVAVGQVLTVQDLRQVSIATDPGVSVVPAAQAAAVVGRTVATSLPAGSLLNPRMVGRAWVAPGQAIAALGLKAGQFPPELAPGARVVVVSAPGAETGATGIAPGPDVSGQWPGTVISVAAPADGQTTVVSVQLGQDAARQVAAIPPGGLSVVMLPGGGS